VRAALLDTGPIVSLLSEADEHHKASMEAIKAAAGTGRTLCTTWEVIGEAYTRFRMRLSPPDLAEPALEVLRWARESAVELLATTESDHQRAATLLGIYGQLRLSYVDALLLAVAERHRVEELITVDARHFRAVRLTHRMSVTVV
jgi:predicted nucleic acid-binding protein